MEVGKPHASIWREDHHPLAIKVACAALWSWNLDDDRFEMDECSFELWGLPWADAVSLEQLSTHIHPQTGTGSEPPSQRPAQSPAHTRLISGS